METFVKENALIRRFTQAGCTFKKSGQALTGVIPKDMGEGIVSTIEVEKNTFVSRGSVFLYEDMHVLVDYPKATRRYVEFYHDDKNAGTDAITLITSGKSDEADSRVLFPAERKIRFTTVAVDAEEINSFLERRYLNNQEERSRALLQLRSHLENRRVVESFKCIEQISLHSELARSNLATSVQQFLFHATCNTYERCKCCTRKNTCNSQDRLGLCTVEFYFANHMEESPPVEQLACLAGMSPTKLKVLFRKQYGTTLYGYLRRLRMAEAWELLKEGSSVTDTTFAVGYTSVNRFSEAFRNEYHEYPGRIASRVKKKA